MAAFQKNQLLFNLDVPSRPMNMAAKFHRPEPIVIEKFGCASAPIITAPKSGLRLSVVSEDNLSMAVQLARRDLKKQREEEQLSASQLAAKDKKAKSAPLKGRQASGHANRAQTLQGARGKEQRDKVCQQKENKAKKVLLVKEREKGNKVRAATTQTGRSSRQTALAPSQRVKQNIPVRSYSPPVRDTDPDPTSLSGDARSLADLRNLRKEIDACLLHIRQEQEIAKADQLSRKPEKRVYAEDIEEERKRAMRSEEHAARSARTVYMLTQQVREIQDDLNKLGPTNLTAAKRTQILNRLVAAHRGAVRALHTFQQHLSDFTLTKGLPRSYHELMLLLRQLSLCCTQMEIAGETGVPDSVLNILKDYQDMNKALEADFHSSPKSPPRPCQVAAEVRDKKKWSPASRRLEYDMATTTAARPAQEAALPRRPLVQEKVPTHGHSHAVAGPTPDRQAALRAGVAALVRAGESPLSSPRLPSRHKSPVPPLDLPESPRTPKGVAWEYPLEKPELQQWKKTGNKGLLLPNNLQAKRQKIQKVKIPMTEAHYAEPTKSSKMKEVPPSERPLSPPRSPRSPRQSARSPRSPSPRASSLPGSPRQPISPRYPGYSPRSPGYRSRSPGYSPRSPGARDFLHTVQKDREKALQRSERARINKLRHDLGQSEEWLETAENRIREKLQPLLDRAQALYEAHTQMLKSDAKHLCSKCLLKHVSVNADLLTDSLLADMLEDTARELDDGERDATAEHGAMAMQDAPSLETMLQRLHDMEDEQQDIRRRWATLVYEDEKLDFPSRAKYFDAPLSDQPTSPTPIHLTSQLPPPQHTLLPDYVLNRLETQHSDNAAIMFTKSQPKPIEHSSLHLSHQPSGALQMEPPKPKPKLGIPICLSEEVLVSISANRANFEQHLKKAAHQSVGRFDPWQLVEEVSNQIVDDCLMDICRELDDINSDIVNHVYTAEFATPAKDEESPSVQTGRHFQAKDLNGSYLNGQAESVGGLPVENPASVVGGGETAGRNSSRGSDSTGQISDRGSASLDMNSHVDDPIKSSSAKDTVVERHIRNEPASDRVDKAVLLSEHSDSRSKASSVASAKAVPAVAQSPSPVSENYSYDDDFVDSSPRGKTPRDDTIKSEISQDSWPSD